MTSAVSYSAWMERPGIGSAIRRTLGPLDSDASPNARKLLIVHGDRGSGRSALLGAVREKLAGVVPVGAIDLSDPRYQTIPDCLAILAEKLEAQVRGHDRLVFPRLLVGLAAHQVSAAAEENGVVTRDAVRERLGSVRVKSPGRIALEQTVGGAKVTVPLGPLGSIAGIALPIVVVGQAVDLRLLRPYVNWYGESPSGPPQDGLDVLTDLARDGRDAQGRDLDAALCAAFVADLHHALSRSRQAPVPAILLDNADQTTGEQILERFVQAHERLPGRAPFPAAVIATTTEPALRSSLVTGREVRPLDAEQCFRLLSRRDGRAHAVVKEEARLVHEFSGGNAKVAATLVRAYGLLDDLAGYLDPPSGSRGVSPAFKQGVNPCSLPSLHSGSILVVDKRESRESLNLRVPPDLKRKIEAHAERMGISINAAACVLLAEGLRAERRRDR